MALSGVNRKKVQDITTGKLRGKALADALAASLNSEGAKPMKHAKRNKK
jgi:hypothetical protein